MAYAGEIINESFNRTKELFFPIRPKYWFKMGFVSLMTGNGQGGNYNGSSGSSGKGLPADMTLKQLIAEINAKALTFLSQYGYIIGISIIVLYFIGLLFSYLASVFTFVFIDGIVKKEISIKKAFSEYNKQGTSLFKLKFVVGLISLAITLAIFSPIINAFFTSNLAEFNFWLLIPMFLSLIALSIPIGIFFLLVEDFVVPIMYTKKCYFTEGWNEFRKIASGRKVEILIYFLLKIGLSVVAGLGSFIVLLPLLLIIVALGALGLLIYYALNLAFGQMIAILTTVILALIVVSALIYLLTVLFVPVPVFFRIYSLEMVKKMQEARIAKSQ